jgi:hypothetical protein
MCLGYLDILGMFRLRAGDFREAKYLSGAALNMTSLRRHRSENVFQVVSFWCRRGSAASLRLILVICICTG